MREIAFRSLGVDDLQSIFLWLLKPHVAKWYSAAPGSFMTALLGCLDRAVLEPGVRGSSRTALSCNGVSRSARDA